MERRIISAQSLEVATQATVTIASRSDETEEGVSAQVPPLDGAPSDEASPWPDENAEAAFLSEQPGLGRTLTSAKVAPEIESNAEEAPVTLPSMQSLIDRIPASAKEVLEELFRAKFVSVRQVPKTALKN